MAKARKPNAGVNKVRRKAQEQDISLSSRSQIPEDDKKSIRKQGGKLDVHHARRLKTQEEQTLRKGRAPKQETPKQYKDRHSPRKTELEKQYTHEVQKLRNKLKYREKQGFFIKWETLPARPTRITNAEIDKLSNYAVTLNKNNEIELVRVKYKEQARELRIKRTDRPNYDIYNDPNFVPPMESVQNFDVFNRIEDTLIRDISIVQNDGSQLDHPLDEQRWVDLSDSCEQAYQEALELFRSYRDSHNRQEYADYLVAHESEIISAIDLVLTASDQDQVAQAKEEMLRYLQPH